MQTSRNYPKAYIDKSELDFISRCVLDYPNLETGGDFFGFWSREGFPIIQYVIGPGKNTTRTSSSFYQDIPYLKECGAFLNNNFRLEHIGGWHSHHKLSLDHPSGGDINTMRNALRNGNLPRFLVSICNIERNSKVSINGFIFSRDSSDDYIPCNWEITDGISLIREKIEKMNISLFTSPTSKKATIEVNSSHEPDKISKKHESEKPELTEDSYWNKPEGRTFLKTLFENLKDKPNISNVEILQLADKRIALSLVYYSVAYEIRFPINFPNTKPEIIAKGFTNENRETLPGKIRRILKSEKKMDNLILELLKVNKIIEEIEGYYIIR